MSEKDWADQECEPCRGGIAPMTRAKIKDELPGLDGWEYLEDGPSIRRRFEFKGFAKAVEMANLAAWLGNKQGHHPDIRFGWGYCEVRFTTHDSGGITRNDLICAGKLNALVA